MPVRSARRPLPGLLPVFDGLSRGALGTMEVIDDFSALLRASHAARRLLETPDAGLAARGLERADIVPHAFESYLGRTGPGSRRGPAGSEGEGREAERGATRPAECASRRA